MAAFEESITIKESHKMNVTKTDLLKMIPFSFFIIVPGAELTLPLCLYLFPNMIPSSFISKTKEEKSIIHLLDARNVYADTLHIFMLKQLKDKGPEYENFRKVLKNSPHLLTKDKLVEFHDLFVKFFRFNDMDSETLINVCRLVTMEPWTGFKVIGRLFFEPYYKIKGLITKNYPKELWAPKNFVCSAITKVIVYIQLKRYLKRIREDDYLLLVEDLGVIEQENIIRCCRERAIETENTTFQKIKDELAEWAKFSTHPLTKGKVSNEFLVLTQIFSYLEDIVSLDDDRVSVKPSDERTKRLLQKISNLKLYNFNERMIMNIIDRVQYGSPEFFDEETRGEYVDILKRCLDEKNMPEHEETIKEIIELLESVPPDAEENKIKYEYLEPY